MFHTASQALECIELFCHISCMPSCGFYVLKYLLFCIHVSKYTQVCTQKCQLWIKIPIMNWQNIPVIEIMGPYGCKECPTVTLWGHTFNSFVVGIAVFIDPPVSCFISHISWCSGVALRLSFRRYLIRIRYLQESWWGYWLSCQRRSWFSSIYPN